MEETLTAQEADMLVPLVEAVEADEATEVWTILVI